MEVLSRQEWPSWRHDSVFVVGLAGLLCLLAAAIAGMAGEGEARHPVELLPVPGADFGSVDPAREALLHPGGRDGRSAAQVLLTLPPLQADVPSWILWLPREPVDALWLQRDGWRSPRYGLFAVAAEEGALPGGYAFQLPRDWEGPVELTLHVDGGMRTVLRPRLLRADEAMRLGTRAVGIAAGVYAALFTLSLLALALYAAAHDRSFLWLFGCAAAALLMLGAANGHLYALPVLGLLAAWGAQGVLALMFLFLAIWLRLLRHYTASPGPKAPAARAADLAVVALLAATGICLLDLRWLDSALQALANVSWAAVGTGSALLLATAGRRRLRMAWPLILLLLPVLALALLREIPWLGGRLDMAVTRYALQGGLVGLLAVLAIGLVGRIREYRDQRDRERLARADTERRMQREAARTDLTDALQSRLRQLAPGDVEWTAFRTLFDCLLPLLPAESMVAVVRGYHGRDVFVAHPAEHKDALLAEVGGRLLPLKRLAASGIAQQQPVAADAATGTEAMIPLQIRAPAWGAVLLRRGDGFSSEEMALATEFVHLTQGQIDQAIAAINLRRSAELDALTGSLNRRSIDQWLARCFDEADRDRQPLSILFVDLDHFKAVNDRHGHACGDHCLRAVAAALRGALAVDDLFGRYGGEEFIAILSGRGGAAARQVGEDLRMAVEQLAIDWEGQTLRLTVSVGVATRRDGERIPADAIRRADNALYAAKRGGRNCVHVAPAVFS